MTNEQISRALAAHMLGFDFNPPDVSRIADYLLPVVRELIEDARRDAAVRTLEDAAVGIGDAFLDENRPAEFIRATNMVLDVLAYRASRLRAKR